MMVEKESLGICNDSYTSAVFGQFYHPNANFSDSSLFQAPDAYSKQYGIISENKL